jgi:hypothetical protein
VIYLRNKYLPLSIINNNYSGGDTAVNSGGILPYIYGVEELKKKLL